MTSKFRGVKWNNARFPSTIKIRRSIDLAELGDFGSITENSSDLPTAGATHRKATGGSTSATRGYTDLQGLSDAVVDNQDMGLVSDATTTHRVWSSMGAITDVVTSAPTTLGNPPTLQANTFTNTTSHGHTFVVPDGVTSISAVAIGGGGGADYFKGGSTVYMATGGWGGDLSYANDIPVTPGEELKVYAGWGGSSVGGWFYSGFRSYTPTEGRAGRSSWIERSNGTVILRAKGGNGGGTSSYSYNNDSNIGDVSYSGGSGTTNGSASGGGGAAGYAGNGGNGAPNSARYPEAGSGAAAGGAFAMGGGGVGLYGLSDTATEDGQGGSGGGNANGKNGGLYGGGSGGRVNFNDSNEAGDGAVRILWNGNSAFPSTNVGLSEDEEYFD